MEKEGNDKTNTELDDSVTSEEQNSLAERNDNDEELSKDKVESSDSEEPLTVAEVDPEVLQEKDNVIAAAEEPLAKSVDILAANPEVTVEEEKEVAEPDIDKNELAAENSASDKPLTVAEVEPEVLQEKDDVIAAAEEPLAKSIDLPATNLGVTVEEEKVVAEPDTDENELAAENSTNEVPITGTTPEQTEVADEEGSKKVVKEDSNIKGEEEKSDVVDKKKSTEPSVDHHDSNEEHSEFKDIDFAACNKAELVEIVKKLGKDENPFKADKVLQKIAPLFNSIRAQERAEALKKFIDNGGEEDAFEYKPDEFSLRFDANYKLIKDKKTKKFKEQDIQRHKNHVLGEQVLEELRAFMDSEESSNSFNQFKAIQQKWKDIGNFPSQNSRTLWANYNALVHRFYDQRSIYFELKELDRKKNYEAKLVLCDKAEALENVENLREAISGLNELHDEFKHLGPVPHEVQEDLWQRLKTASDKVYERRKAFVHELKSELHENLIQKQQLVETIKTFVEFKSDRIKDWNEKTKELIALQKAWEKAGGLPKDKAKQLNKEFWSSFKKFFGNKHLFFKQLEAERGANLEKKQVLLDTALALKDSEDWDKTADEFKKLQDQWRKIGPVPEKIRQKVYEQFKAACDHFFNNKRSGQKSAQDQYIENYKKKREIVSEINLLKEDADNNLDKFNVLRKQFLEIGFVPKKNINQIKEAYKETIKAYLNALSVLNDNQKTEISLEAEFSNLASSEHSEGELYHKEQAVRRQIKRIEEDVALWQNNLEFFARSKSADKLREDVNKKIDSAKSQIDALKRQLKMLRSL